ncbi:MAG: HAD family hydrolase [Alphaproteobacteria bacterium CG_4_9_14_3_um_filter_47_13]|nr:MAG: HAD family hydrolase [Alphaproteobacteria bacterium CG_4_9_14_3_um_filter_47_13]
MSLQKPTIVLFDMDGTVIRHINPLLLHVLERIDDFSHKCARFFSWMFNRKIQSPPLVEFRDGKRKKLLVHRAMHKFRRKEIEEIVEPCPGIYDILDLLRANHIPMGIISNGLGKGYGHDVLRKFDLDKYFEITIFREDITRPKPYPDPILEALKKMTRPPEKNDVIWYIGDRHKDVKAALAAELYLPCDIQPIAYTLNAAIAVLEHNIGPDHIIMGWPDLEATLQHMFRDQKKEKADDKKIKRIF